MSLMAGCGNSETKQQECWAMTEKAEHDICVAELRGELQSSTAGATSSGDSASVSSGAGPHRQLPMPYVVTVFFDSEDGYRAEAELRRGRPAHVEAGLENGSLPVGSSCAVDEQRDAVEPFVLKITNRTDGFRSLPGLTVAARTPHGELPNARYELNWREGPCDELVGNANTLEGSEGFVLFSAERWLEPGESEEAEGWLYLKGYYSPRYPNGDPARWSQVLLTIEPELSNEHLTVAQASGVLDSSSFPSAVPMIPGQQGGCLAHPPCEAAFKVE
jgi:hypothetical protein